jgi:hypothetical protein
MKQNNKITSTIMILWYNIKRIETVMIRTKVIKYIVKKIVI